MSDLERLAADLNREAKEVLGDVRAVLSKGALNIKNDWRSSATGLRHARRYPYSIGYDVNVRAFDVQAVIGPDKNKTQGPLGNLIEFGSAHNPPHNDGGRALKAEEPRTVQALERIVGRRLA